MTVHSFASSGEAYDASQCDDDIKHGDILVVESENVVGILVQAWPVAVSLAEGVFHKPNPEIGWHGLLANLAAEGDPIDSFNEALDIAMRNGSLSPRAFEALK